MKKIFVVILCMIVILTLSACYYDIYQLFKENVRWQSDDGRISFTIQGPDSERIGIGTININGNNQDVIFVFESGHSNLGCYTLEMYHDQSSIDRTFVLKCETNIIDSETIDLDITSNLSGDDTYDEYITIYREDLDDDELNAMYFIDIAFTNDSYGIYIEQTIDTPFKKTAFGHITDQNGQQSIKFVYVDETHYEIYHIVNDELLFSGTYTTTMEQLKLSIVDDFYFTDTLTNITLEFER